MAMNADDYDMIKMHVHGGSQRRADGADHYAENLRYAYLTGKDRVSFAESTGIRHTEESGSGSARRMDFSTPQPPILVTPVKPT
jgi:hypothetical protein